jgi:hypothetical protein
MLHMFVWKSVILIMCTHFVPPYWLDDLFEFSFVITNILVHTWFDNFSANSRRNNGSGKNMIPLYELNRSLQQKVYWPSWKYMSYTPRRLGRRAVDPGAKWVIVEEQVKKENPLYFVDYSSNTYILIMHTCICY